MHDTRREQRKEATTRSGATAPTERHCADKARHTKGSKTKSPFCVVLKTYHLTGIHHTTCLKHSNFLNRKLCVQLLPTWNTMVTARGQGTEGKQNTQKRVETRFKTRQLQHSKWHEACTVFLIRTSSAKQGMSQSTGTLTLWQVRAVFTEREPTGRVIIVIVTEREEKTREKEK